MDIFTNQASMIFAGDVNEAYLKILKELTKKEDGRYIHFQKNHTNELSNAMICIEDVSNPMILRTTEPKEMNGKIYDDILAKYGLAEQVWYFTGDNSTKNIGNFAKMWNHLSDDGQHANSAYGYIIFKKFGFDQLKKVIKELKQNPESRRATIKINTPHTNGVDITTTKDEYCTMYLDFSIRDNQLNLFTAMRSNDIWFGFPSDILFFVNLQKLVAKELNLFPGTYTHLANSLHMYERDFEKAEKLIPFLEKESTKEMLQKGKMFNFNIQNFLNELPQYKKLFVHDAFVRDIKEVKQEMLDLAIDKSILY